MVDATTGNDSADAADSYAEHDIATALKKLKTYIRLSNVLSLSEKGFVCKLRKTNVP